MRFRRFSFIMNMKNMEIDPFKRSSPEASSHDEDSSSESSSKKKKKSRRLPLFHAETESKEEPAKEADEKTSKEDATALWQKLINQATETTAEKSEGQAPTTEKEADKAEAAAEKAAAATAALDKTAAETAAETNEAADDVPLESLTGEEQAAVTAEYIAARRAEIASEQAQAADSTAGEEQAERAADLALLDAMQHMLERTTAAQPDGEIQKPLQDAYEATMQRLAELAPSDEPEHEIEDPVPLPPDAIPQPQDFPHFEGTANKDAATPEDAAAAAAAVWQRSGSGGTHHPAGGGGAGAGGFGGTHGANIPAGPGSVGGNVIFSRPNVLPVAPRVSTTETVDDRRNYTGTALLLGGVVGYLVGRRRGRIKTEKRLKTVEKKLTGEVKAVRQQVAEKEQQIRKLARETFQQKRRALPSEAPIAAAGVAPAVLLAERPAEKPAEAALPAARRAETVQASYGAEKMAPLGRPERQPALRDERLGLGVLTLRAAETAPAQARNLEAASDLKSLKKETNAAAERLTKQQRPEQEVPKNSATMDRTELLQTSGEIRVGATNLRRVYETNLISEQGLRRLVAVHERGGNVREVLEQELTEKEMSFERDPRLRNRSRSMVGALASSAVVRKQIDEPSDSAPASAGDSQSAPGANKQNSEDQGKQTAQKATMTAGIAMAIVLAVLLYLLFTGRSL